MPTVAITGASGFLGSSLVESFRANGWQLLKIGRGTSSDIRWNPNAGELDAARLNGADAVISLAGESIAQRWTSARKREIRDSRVNGTSLIARVLAGLSVKPRVLLSGSAVGVYGAHRGDEVLTEGSALGTDFLASVAKEWEEAAGPAREAGIRVAHLRTGLPLSPKGGVLQRLLPVFSLGGGGKIGNGAQWMSWIALSDWVRAVRFLIDSSMAGPVNVVGPSPVTNAMFTDALGHVLKRPTLMTVPEIAIKLAFGEMGANTILASQRALPESLRSAGFAFDYPELVPALQHEIKGV